MTALLSVQGLRKSFGGVHVLKDISFSIPEGGMRVLIGPNGCGKSTFLKALIGMHRPEAGTILFDGKRIDGLLPHIIARRGISTKLQVPSVYRELTVYQNVRIAAQRHIGKSANGRADAIDETLAIIGLIHKADEPAGQLSHGHQQWLEIGMAISTYPRLLLLDEPTAGMTAEETQQTVQLVARLNKERRMGVIIVEHDMHFVSQLDAPCLVINDGRIFFEGRLEEVRANEAVREIYFGTRA